MIAWPDGEFRIPEVAVGDCVIHVWHQRGSSIRRQIRVEPDIEHELQLLLLTRTS